MGLLQLLAGNTEFLPELENLEKLGKSPSRRKMLLGGAAGLASFWQSISEACAPNSDTPANQPIRWLVNRLTFGLTPAELADATTRGYSGYLEYQLDHLSIDDSALETSQPLATYTSPAPNGTLNQTSTELFTNQPAAAKTQLTEATMLRSFFSRRQLYQRMVEFWTDHFNIDINMDNEQWYKVVDDRDVIRANALGTFPALLLASAQSPAMLYYLNNDLNIAGRPNENYARELMELHTLSASGGYTQTDVQEVARCFTGWQLWRSGATAWQFRYNSGQHDTAAKTVLGHTIPARTAAAGMQDGIDVLNILTTDPVWGPVTGNFLATKLCRRFYGENPPASLVNAVAAAYWNNGVQPIGDIKNMLRALFNNVDPLTVPPKYKRPYHLMASMLRTAGANVTSLSSLRNGSQYGLNSMGQLPFYWSPPDGYPDTMDAWIGLILPRWNLGFQLANNSISGAAFITDTFLGYTAGQTGAQVLNTIEMKLYGALGIMPAGERSRLLTYLGDPSSSTRRKDTVGLAFASPSFQWH